MRKPGNAADRPAPSFLTQEQREALDAALSKKRAEQPAAPPVPAAAVGDDEVAKPQLGKNPHSEGVKTKRELAHDHHLNRKGKGTGRTKKAGAGGKYTWGAMLADGDEGATVDPNDPNYDSGDDTTRAVSFHEERSTQIAMFKKAVAMLLEEYYNSGDLNEAAVSLQELDHPEFGHYAVKRALATAFDKHAREREMTSVLLSTLYNEVIAPEQVRKGFTAAIEGLDDFKLDVPDVVDQLATFICRAVVDDVLPPSFVKRIDGPAGSLAAELRHKCELHLGAKHSAERLARCWGSGAGFKFDETKDSIRSMLQEYAASGDKEEVRRILRDLAVPFFHHEFVKQALLLGMDAPSQEPFLGLLGLLSDTAEVSTSQMSKGFQRVADNLPDISLDNPAARERFDAALKAARAGAWVEEGFTGAPTTPSTPGTPGAELNGTASTPFHPNVQAFKASALDIVREYFDSGDASEVAERLAELDEPGFHNIFVKHAVQLAMDRKDRERELVSAALPDLVPRIISGDQVALGFTRLLAGLDDLALDIPDAARLMELFLGRAIVDEVLPPRFLAEAVPHLEPDSLGLAVVQQTGTLLSAKHAAERFDACWHGGVATIEALREQMAALLVEYLASGDLKEAERCLQNLNVPHFHHDFVTRSLLTAFEREGEAGKVLGLLKQLADSGEVNQTQMAKGFARVEARLDDTALDQPRAPELFKQWKAQAQEQGWLAP
ncbi:programmed cell death 4-like isoform B [Chlorella sorokiniana]|uniref:Programmed cell death 4-like isoform B n=1 Tax=Chlorella sorokiniana TaxID=3076 RepID=A0A2P6TUY2_CHLSO|nr:programmed cell death 4-like isoform B [Chlorella sorokiniana]|eukprot:PRW57868.1 programmed cell death 4-like isoform B [Chlorella sorokiniana]